MCGNKIAVAFGLLLATAYARPGHFGGIPNVTTDGYGVKGGNPHRAAAQSSATASAFASAIGTSNAAAAAAAEANANSFGYGENNGKAISSATAIANANPIEGSDGLGQSNDREKDTEYKTVNHQDGTPAWNQHIANADHDGLGNNENSASGTIDVNKSATVCHPGDLKCRNSKNKPSVSNPHPTYNEHPDLSAGSSQPLPNLDGGWGGNTGNSGTRPCNCGNHKVSENQPGGSHMDQSYQEHVQVPAVNEHADRGNSAKPGSRPCTSGSPKCSGSQPGNSNPDQSHVDFPTGSEKPENKPSVSNPYPTYNEHPDLSAGSSQPLPKQDGGWGGNSAKPGSHPCTSGSPKCSGSQPGNSNPDQSHVDFPAGSEKPENKPSVSNPYPTHNEHPDLSAGSSQPLPKPDGGWGGNSPKPGSHPCTSGSPKCSGSQPGNSNPDQSHVDFPAGSEKPENKPSVSNPYPTYNEHPDLSAGSSQPLPKQDGGWGGNSAKPGSRPCTSGSPKCSGSQPGDSNPDQSHVDFPAGSEKPVNKPSVSNPYPTYNEHPDLSAGSSQPLPKLDGGWGGLIQPIKPSGAIDGVKVGHQHNKNPSVSNSDSKNHEVPKSPPCASSGSAPCSTNKPTVSNTHPTEQKRPDSSNGSSRPLPELGHGCGDNTANPGSRSCNSGPSPGKPGNTNPFLNGEISVSDIQKAVKSGGSSTGPSAIKPNPSNPFLNPHDGHLKPPTGIHHTGKPSGNDHAGSSHHYPDDTKPNPSNPFLNPHDGHVKPPTGIHHTGKPSGNDQAGSSHHYPAETKPNPSNPFLNPHDGHVKPPTGIHHTGKPSGNDQAGSFHQHPDETKPNPSNPFLNPHDGHVKPPTGIHHTGKPSGNDHAGSSHQHPDETKPNPSNPFLNPHDGHVQPPTGIHHTGKPSGNEKPGSSNQYPETKPNPSNPFLNPHGGHVQPPTGIYHTEKPNANDQAGSSNHYPEIKPNPSNPFLNPHNEHPSTDEKHPNSSNESGNSRQYPKQQNTAVPSTSHQGHVDNVACSFASCKNKAHNSDIDIDHSVTDKFGEEKTSSTPSYAVKTHRAGVKGGSIRTPENSRLSKYDDSGNGNKALVNSNAYSQAHAVASSSAGGESSAHAKSQAYSSADASGSSSWSSSSASASASAFSSSWH